MKGAVAESCGGNMVLCGVWPHPYMLWDVRQEVAAVLPFPEELDVDPRIVWWKQATLCSSILVLGSFQ